MIRAAWVCLALLMGWLPLLAQAACLQNAPDMLHNYDGTIGDGLRVRMSLVLQGEKVQGLYFYGSQLKDIALQGQLTQGTDLVLDELDAQGQAVARLQARFADHDPKGRLPGSDLGCSVIIGTWQALGAAQSLPVYLALESSTMGSLTQRYQAAGADDDALVHRRALLFRDAVKRADKQAVAGLLAYPVPVQLAGRPSRLRNAADLLAHYDAIFSARYRAAIASALPRNMFVRYQGIMLGKGEVWFGPDGRVIALNNQ